MQKSIWAGVKESKKGSFWKWSKRILLALAFLVVLQVIYFLLTFYTNLWMYYPGIYRFQAAFSRMQTSCQRYPYQELCKDRCGLEREGYHQAMVDYLSKDETKTAYNQIKSSILNQNNSDCFRTELIDVIYNYQEKNQPDQKVINPPDYLIDYLINGQRLAGEDNNAVEQEILDLYGKSAFSGQVFQKLLREVQDPKTPCETRYYAITNLGRFGNSKITRPIFQKLIEGNKGPKHLWIAYWAANSLSPPKQKDRKFVSWCKDIIWGDYNEYVKEKIEGDLVIYEDNIPKEKQYILDILKKIYFDKSQSKYLRDDVASILQYNLGEGAKKIYPNPKISDQESDEHYNGCPTCVNFCPSLNNE